MIKKHIAQSNDSNFEERVKELLLYRRIVEVQRINDMDGILILDNGTQLIVEGNRGCGGCYNGWYDLCELNNCDNAITDVKCDVMGDYNDFDEVYSIFVYAEDKRVKCVEFSGGDNGYYGTGYDLYVRVVGDTE
jgi:hypothetical protein